MRKKNKTMTGEEIGMTVTYGMIEEIYSIGEASRISYGIAAYVDETNEGVVAVHDITSDKPRLARLVASCNRLKLSLCHMQDVIDDFFAE